MRWLEIALVVFMVLPMLVTFALLPWHVQTSDLAAPLLLDDDGGME